MHRPSDPEKRHALLEAWYLDQARAVYAERLEVVFEPFAQRGHTKPRIQVMQLEKRWGSLTPAGTVVLSRDLVRAPFSCIDYVIVHELCHLEQPNHGPGFHRLLARIMPDASVRKALLERTLA
jgi:predicted metal-dependent hydrolase